MALLQAALDTGNLDIALIAATISILIGGIMFGVGFGFGARRVRLFGVEEIGQGILSAIMIGAVFAFIQVSNVVAESAAPPEAITECVLEKNSSSLAYAYYACNLENISASSQLLGYSLSRSADITGFVSSLKISAGSVSAQPFFALESASGTLQEASIEAYQLHALSLFQIELANSIAAAAFSIFLPVGLLLRSFFATRKLGAAAMAIAIAAYLVYPLLFLHTFMASGTIKSLDIATESSDSFNEEFASVPHLELEKTGAVKDKIDEMSTDEFGTMVQPLFSLSFSAFSQAKTDLLVYPLISLLVSAIAAFELYLLLSAPIFLPYFESV